MNHKRVERVYRELGLTLRRKKRKHCERVGRPLVERTAPNQEWGLDFVHDAVECGRTIRVLSVVDAYTRECLALEVDTSFASRRVTRVLEEIARERGLPQSIRCDNGPELTSRHFLAWAIERKIEMLHIQPGKADAECSPGELQRQAAGGVLERELVSESVRRAGEDLGLAERVQQRASPQQFGIQDPERVCRTGKQQRLLRGWCGARGLAVPLPHAPIPAESEDRVNINFRIQNCAK